MRLAAKREVEESICNAIAIVLICGTAVAAAQTAVNELTDLRGQVDIDAFARGDFLPAR